MSSQAQCITNREISLPPDNPALETYIFINEETIDDNLKCPICFSPFRNPVLVQCCTKPICLACVIPLVRCPFCRGVTDPLLAAPEYLIDIISDLPVQCKFCAQITDLANFPVHYETFCPIPCQFGCGELITRKSRILHAGNCRKRRVKEDWWFEGAQFSIPGITDFMINQICSENAFYRSGPAGSHLSGAYNFTADRNYLTKRQLQMWIEESFCVYVGGN